MALRCLEHVVWGMYLMLTLLLIRLQTRPTCHNQLAVKADGEMRSPLGEQRWPVFRDGAGRLSSYRGSEIQPRRDDYDADRGAIRERASKRAGNRNDDAPPANPLSASTKPIQSFSRDFNELETRVFALSFWRPFTQFGISTESKKCIISTMNVLMGINAVLRLMTIECSLVTYAIIIGRLYRSYNAICSW